MINAKYIASLAASQSTAYELQRPLLVMLVSRTHAPRVMRTAFQSEFGTGMDVQRSLSDIYNTCDLSPDTRPHLGAQEALQRTYHVRNARVCKERNKGVHLGLDPVPSGWRLQRWAGLDPPAYTS